VEESGVLNSPRRRVLRGLAIHWLFGSLNRLQALGRLLGLYQQLGLQTLVRRSGVLGLLPQRLRELEAITPQIQPAFSSEMIPSVTAATGRRRYRVAMLTGCAQDLVFSDVNRDTVEVLSRNGCEVITPSEQFCCGSLHAHNGEWELAQDLARKQIDQFPPERFDAIITNAGGCGSHLKHFHKLLSDDPVYAERARFWDLRVKDIHEWLWQIGIEAPPNEQPTQVVTYHDSCHLAHGQKITAEPRRLLELIPNLKLVELPESSWCCGSAGIYNLIQPEMANELLSRKLTHIKATRATVVATGNPGCLLQLINGARQQGLNLRIVHPITLLAEAYHNP
jgi:glycolate oxidase iron-sulfur subunit